MVKQDVLACERSIEIHQPCNQALKGMQLLRVLINPGFITTKISWPLYTPQFKTFNITLTSKPPKGSKILPGLLCKHYVSGKTMHDHSWTI